MSKIRSRISWLKLKIYLIFRWTHSEQPRVIDRRRQSRWTRCKWPTSPSVANVLFIYLLHFVKSIHKSVYLLRDQALNQLGIRYRRHFWRWCEKKQRNGRVWAHLLRSFNATILQTCPEYDFRLFYELFLLFVLFFLTILSWWIRIHYILVEIIYFDVDIPICNIFFLDLIYIKGCVFSYC